MPFLFQRRISGDGVIGAATVREMLQRACADLATSHQAFADVTFTPRDFRRLFANELVSNGLPIHIGAKLLGHLDLQTTQGYVAVFEEDMVRHYQQFLARRLDLRPADEYGDVTAREWSDFEEHFDKRKVELGSCARPYGTPCQHEHAGVRCPMLHVDPRMLPRMRELEDDLVVRRRRAVDEGWLGEIDGIDLTLQLLGAKGQRGQAHTAHGRARDAWPAAQLSNSRQWSPAGGSAGISCSRSGPLFFTLFTARIQMAAPPGPWCCPLNTRDLEALDPHSRCARF